MSIKDLAAFTYTGKATGVFYFDASEGKNEQIVIEIELLNEGADAQGAPILGQKVWYFGTFADLKAGSKKSATEITMGALRALGWTCDNVAKLDGLGSIEADIVIGPETYEGKTSNRIKFINKPGEGGRPTAKAELAGPQLNAFAQRMLNAAKASRGGGAATKAPAGPPPLRATGTDGPPATETKVDSGGTLVAPGGKKLF